MAVSSSPRPLIDVFALPENSTQGLKNLHYNFLMVTLITPMTPSNPHKQTSTFDAQAPRPTTPRPTTTTKYLLSLMVTK